MERVLFQTSPGKDLTCEIESGLCSGCLCPDQSLPYFRLLSMEMRELSLGTP